MGASCHGFQLFAKDDEALVNRQIVNANKGRARHAEEQVARRLFRGKAMNQTLTLARLLLLRSRTSSLIAKSGAPKLRPLYVYRSLLNGAEVAKWAKGQGIPATLPPADMHVTVLYSKRPVDWLAMPEGRTYSDGGKMTINPGGARVLDVFGHDEERCLVLRFKSWELTAHNRDMMEAGASSDYPDYAPHVTITYKLPASFDVDAAKPYDGPLVFGPAMFEAIKEGGFDPSTAKEK